MNLGEDDSKPSTKIAACISSFLSCLDKDNDIVKNSSKEIETKEGELEEGLGSKSSIALTSKTKTCYQSFQDCSGSVILIPNLYNGTTTINEEFQGFHTNEDVK